ncbi:MAG: hypothetical protein ACLQVN_23680 [Bryobacteraceae bacterium]
MQKPIVMETKVTGRVHCPICTHTVPAEIALKGRHVRLVSGQKCGRCGSSLDVAPIVQVPQAA